jgi:hypothetical protein
MSARDDVDAVKLGVRWARPDRNRWTGLVGRGDSNQAVSEAPDGLHKADNRRIRLIGACRFYGVFLLIFEAPRGWRPPWLEARHPSTERLPAPPWPQGELVSLRAGRDRISLLAPS